MTHRDRAGDAAGHRAGRREAEGAWRTKRPEGKWMTVSNPKKTVLLQLIMRQEAAINWTAAGNSQFSSHGLA
ncbi:MAG: hypothetical protein IH993_01350 [Proteobacteria bacterium]|nr:hypothetical protein [Pseudomonadota bacterium]